MVIKYPCAIVRGYQKEEKNEFNKGWNYCWNIFVFRSFFMG